MSIEMVEEEAFNSGTMIKVIGVGGGGGNAVEHMINTHVQGVEFICANTDAQALRRSAAHKVIQLGQSGLGAGSRPERGRDAAMAEVALAHLPSVVLAGNGHAWKHLGVPFVVNQVSPHSQTLSVLFMEWDDGRPLQEKQAFLADLASQADYVWLTPAQSRENPCMKLLKK